MIVRRFLILIPILLFPLVLFSGELKLLTINVWSGLDYKGTLKMGEYEAKEVRARRFKLLVQEIKRLNPDVVVVNEANPLPRYAWRLARALNYDQIHVIGNAGIKLGCFGLPLNLKEGDAILARRELQLRRIGKKRLSGDRFGIWTDWITFHFQETNNLLLGKITFQGVDICIAATHLYAGMPNDESKLFWVMQRLEAGEISPEESREILTILEAGERRRMTELKHVLEYLVQQLPVELPVVLMGDLNAEPDSPELVMLTIWREFIDTYAVANPGKQGYTWDPVNNSNISQLQLAQFDSRKASTLEKLQHKHDSTPRRIDYILLSPHFSPQQVIRSRVVFDQPYDGQFISDHYGVFSVIKIGD